MNLRRSVSDKPILSKFSAEVTISVQPMVPPWPHLEDFRDGRDVYGDNRASLFGTVSARPCRWRCAQHLARNHID